MQLNKAEISANIKNLTIILRMAVGLTMGRARDCGLSVVSLPTLNPGIWRVENYSARPGIELLENETWTPGKAVFRG